jgi:hypothetical protein
MDEHLRDRLLMGLEILHGQFQRREATAWLIVCYDGELDPREHTDGIVGAYGPFATPEEALIELVKHDESSDPAFKNVIVPLYPPVLWKDEQ